MADVGIVGAQPGTLVTELDQDTYQRRRSSAIARENRRSSVAESGRRPSVIEKLSARFSISAPQKRFSQSDHDSETKFEEAQQARGETFAEGGHVRYYKPIDTYEGRHRWDPEAEWTETEEKKVIRKVI